MKQILSLNDVAYKNFEIKSRSFKQVKYIHELINIVINRVIRQIYLLSAFVLT